jgi:hypothetical protein
MPSRHAEAWARVYDCPSVRRRSHSTASPSLYSTPSVICPHGGWSNVVVVAPALARTTCSFYFEKMCRGSSSLALNVTVLSDHGDARLDNNPTSKQCSGMDTRSVPSSLLLSPSQSPSSSSSIRVFVPYSWSFPQNRLRPAIFHSLGVVSTVAKGFAWCGACSVHDLALEKASLGAGSFPFSRQFACQFRDAFRISHACLLELVD